MRVIKTRSFAEWADNEGLTDKALWSAVLEMEQGLVDVNLGGNVYKKRIAIKGAGKRGGARTLIATRFKGTIFYMYGFSKNMRTNISKKELKALKMLAEQLLSYSGKGIDKAIIAREFIEVESNEKNNS